MSDVSSALAELRHRSRDSTSARTAVMTFVAVAGDEERASTARSVLRTLSSHHPARLVILRPDTDAVASLDARAALFSVERGGHEVDFEEIELQVCGQAARHLDSLADAFTISDLPVATWYVGAIPDVADPLLTISTAVLVDSRDAAGSGGLRSLVDLSQRHRVVDLSWMRLKPFRRLLASVFSDEQARRWLGATESVRVWGKAGPRHMLGGWLVAQLGLRPAQVQLHDERHVRVEIECRLDDVSATFEIARGPQRTLVAHAHVPELRCPPQHASLPDDALGASLADALLRLEDDPVWERALAAATLLEE